jgi:protein-S-isoprenylcysteine O-methyltransferase Ste14
MFTNAALILLVCLWQPLGGSVWTVDDPAMRAALWSLYAFGLFTVLLTTLLINHFDLFGLRQVWLYFRGKPYTNIGFRTPGPYCLVRHPLYVGWITVFWATPTMTLSHLVFALGMTAYILAAIPFEERDLLNFHGKRYADYRRKVAMLIPGLRKGAGKRQEDAAPAHAAESSVHSGV